MAAPEPSYPTTTRPEDSNTAHTQTNHIKTNCMKMIDFLKVKMKNLLKKLRQIQRKDTEGNQ